MTSSASTVPGKVSDGFRNQFWPIYQSQMAELDELCPIEDLNVLHKFLQEEQGQTSHPSLVEQEDLTRACARKMIMWRYVYRCLPKDGKWQGTSYSTEYLDGYTKFIRTNKQIDEFFRPIHHDTKSGNVGREYFQEIIVATTNVLASHMKTAYDDDGITPELLRNRAEAARAAESRAEVSDSNTSSESLAAEGFNEEGSSRGRSAVRRSGAEAGIDKPANARRRAQTPYRRPLVESGNSSSSSEGSRLTPSLLLSLYDAENPSSSSNSSLRPTPSLVQNPHTARGTRSSSSPQSIGSRATPSQHADRRNRNNQSQRSVHSSTSSAAGSETASSCCGCCGRRNRRGR